MRTIAFALFMALSFAAVRADIIANGDFHDGKAHWKGDIKAASDQDHYDTSSMDQTGGPPGIVVNLKGGWTKAFQDFNTHDNSFNYSITFQTSADYAPQAAPANGFGQPFVPPNMPHMPGIPDKRNDFLSAILGGDFSGDLRPPTGTDFLLLVVDMTAATYSSALIHPKPGTDSQTVTGSMEHVPAHDKKTLFLVFSGGKGSVTLLNVALTPIESAPNP